MQKTAYEMRISDWSSDVCSSDLMRRVVDWNLQRSPGAVRRQNWIAEHGARRAFSSALSGWSTTRCRSEEHTSELQSLMRISYAVFCLKKKKSRTRVVKYAGASVTN